VLQTADCHAGRGGEPARVRGDASCRVSCGCSVWLRVSVRCCSGRQVGGVPHIPGATVYEKRAHFMEHSWMGCARCMRLACCLGPLVPGFCISGYAIEVSSHRMFQSAMAGADHGAVWLPLPECGRHRSGHAARGRVRRPHPGAGLPAMSGHNMICVTTARMVLETGIVRPAGSRASTLCVAETWPWIGPPYRAGCAPAPATGCASGVAGCG
jgi:hypothetical protein